MVPIPSASRFRLWLGVLFCLLTAQAPGAEVYLRDQGTDGIILGNLPGEGSPPAAAPRLPEAPPPAHRREGRRERLFPLVSAAAAAHGVSESLLTAVIEVESGFDPEALSPKGAVGLMQLMPGTARRLRVGDPRDPAANIDAGARYLKELLERFGNDLHLAVAAYNAGPGAVLRRGGIPALEETRRYVPEVIRRYHELESGVRPRPGAAGG
jgi:soluble lytic murein transglycosylase-like protein